MLAEQLPPGFRLSYARLPPWVNPHMGGDTISCAYHPTVPELPEVETVRRSLERRLPGAVFRRVEVRASELREPLDREALTALEGLCVRSLGRRAKYLLVHLASPLASNRSGTSASGGSGRPDRILVIHLGMSGRFTLVSAEEPYAKHEHLSIYLEDAEREPPRRLRLVDPRRFGQAFVLAPGELATDRHFVHLGLEPLSESPAEPVASGEPTRTLDGGYLEEQARGRRGPMKSFLMDARVVVGVGNIYASEALWRARVHPKRSVARVSAATWRRLADAVREVLDDAVAQGGTTLNDFTDGEGNAGYFQVSLDAYDREDEPCRRCGRPIRRIVQSNRSTYYCPGCQR